MFPGRIRAPLAVLLCLAVPLALALVAAPAASADPLAGLPALTELAPVEPTRVEAIPAPLPVLGSPGPVVRGPGKEDPAPGGGPGQRTGPALEPSPPAAPAASVPPVTSTRPVALRALVIAVDAGDHGLAPWRATLDRVGAAYDVLHADAASLTTSTLVDAGGVGRYNAILLASNALAHDVGGVWTSALEPTEWQTLWAYERDYAVRQATLFTSYGTFPEQSCLATAGEGGVGEPGITATLTAAGARVFDQLNPAARVPITMSYVYRNRVAAGCAAEPLLVSGADVLGLRQVTPDGREQVMLTFSNNEHLLQTHLLAFGMFRWASRGMFLGEQRHFLKLDVDDYFNSSDLLLEDLTYSPTPFRMTGSDAINMRTQQRALRARHPLADQFRLTLAFNGAGVNPSTLPDCRGGGLNRLVASTACVRGEMEWINHTFNHPKMNTTDYATSSAEITRNRSFAAAMQLSVPRGVLKTGEYSGLGVYHPDPDNDIDPPTDHGLMASNPALLQAAVATGVKYLHGNMSFASHVPERFNGSIRHPMNPSIEVVPDWPTNIAYFSATPAQETAFYNMYYGPNGRFPYWPQNQTYAQILEYESTSALHRVAMGSIYTHTMHIPNLSDYGGGRTLAFDWLDAVMTRYDSFYRVPLLSPSWATLAETTSVRNEHVDLAHDVRAVWDRASGRVSISAPRSGRIQVTGVSGRGTITYGPSPISTLPVSATPQWLTARPVL